MKKTIAWMLGLMLALTMTFGCAETTESVLEPMSALTWEFSSGAGAWSTELQIQADGAFTGTFHDAEMGETGENYPDGTLYGCAFHGRMTPAEQVDEYTWKIRIDELAMDEGQVPEAVEDGVRYVTTDPYGISAGDEMLLCMPGTPVSGLTEDMLYWAHLLDPEARPEALEDWLLYSAKNESGFVGYRITEDFSLANPWTDLTAEQLEQASGVAFGVPEGAENVLYRYLPAEGLAEMQFTWNGGEYAARILPVALQEGQLMNISGMYFAWENEEAVTIGRCPGTIGQAQCGSEDWAELCLWYDMAPGLMYSLSVSTTDIDGLDLTAIAEQVYIPMQGEV